MKKEQIFSVKEKIGYGAASVGDTAVYNLLIIYSLFFMTDVVKLDPLIAGNIIFAATVWNAFSVGLIGYVSDHYSLKGGKRLPYMKASILPMAITLVLFFSVIHGTGFLMVAYYMLLMAALMTAHSTFMIPYEALGADLTMNAEERTDLRSFARFFMGIGNLVGVVFLLPAVDWFQTNGFSTEKSWQITIMAIAVIGACSQIMTCVTFKKKTHLGKDAVKGEQTQNFLAEYRDLLKLKPFLCLLLISLLISVANVFCNSSIAYFMKYNLGIAESQKAFVLGIMTVVGIVMTPVLSRLAKRYDKKRVMMICYLITGAAFLIFGLTGMNTMTSLCIYIVIFTVGTSAYWQLIYAMLYDISELDEYRNNRRREAILLSMSKIVLKLSNASATQLLALVLFWFGYDQNAEVQTGTTLMGIEWSLTLIPGILFLGAAIFVKLYPISEKRHLELVKELQRRKEQQ